MRKEIIIMVSATALAAAPVLIAQPAAAAHGFGGGFHGGGFHGGGFHGGGFHGGGFHGGWGYGIGCCYGGWDGGWAFKAFGLLAGALLGAALTGPHYDYGYYSYHHVHHHPWYWHRGYFHRARHWHLSTLGSSSVLVLRHMLLIGIAATRMTRANVMRVSTKRLSSDFSYINDAGDRWTGLAISVNAKAV